MDLSQWRKVPALLMAVGLVLAVIGLLVNPQHFAFCWLLAFMFFLSLCLGALFLVLVHHLFDAGWSVPVRRINEHIASMLFPWMAILFIPIALLCKKLYDWMEANPHLDHALHAKQPLFTLPGFFLVSAFCFGIWWLLSNRLRYWSVKQDTSGAVECTLKMRSYSYWGIFAFAVTVTLASIMWMKALQYDWYSTMYGVYYFAGSTWLALATAYVLTALLDRQGTFANVLGNNQYYYLGSLIFAFTVFYAYIHFAQYFVIWNANMPEETFWYVIREQGTWWWVGLVIIFGHFFIPFLALLRIDVKLVFPYMFAVAAWAWLMHFVDLSFNILPVLSPKGFPLNLIWLIFGCWAFMAGFLAKVFLKKFAETAPYPLKDPRLIEAVGLGHLAAVEASGTPAQSEGGRH